MAFDGFIDSGFDTPVVTSGATGCGITATHISCALGDLTPGAADATSGPSVKRLTFTAKANKQGLAPIRIFESVDVNKTIDPNPANNGDSANITIAPPTVELIGLEVTQAVQNLNNSIPLVAERETFVRAHVQALNLASDGVPASAYLAAKNVATGALLGIVQNSNVGGTIKVLQTRATSGSSRAKLDDSFYFQIPADWTNAGQVEFLFVGNEFPFTCNEADAAKDCKVTVQFQARRKFSIKFVMTTFIDAAGNKYSPTTADLVQTMNEIRANFPMADFGLALQTTWTTTQEYCTAAGVSKILSDLKAMRAADCGPDLATTGNCRAGVEDFHFVILPEPFSNGLCLTSGVAATGMADTKFDRDAIKTDNSGNTAVAMAGMANTRAHELGHTFGLRHTFFPAGPTVGGPDFISLTKDGTISPDNKVDYDPATYFGFDPLRVTLTGLSTLDTATAPYLNHGRLYPANSPDMMSYGPAAWISAYKYRRLFNALAPITSSPNKFEVPDGRTQVSADKLFAIDGLISFIDGTGQIGNVYTLDSTGSVTLPLPGNYAIRIEDGTGSQLGLYSFDVSQFSEGDMGSFAVQLPKDPAARRIILLHNGQIIATRQASANSPTITVTSPNGGETLNGTTTNLTWTAADADNNALTYAVEYSTDGGANWTMLTTNWNTISYPVDSSKLPASNQALIRVTASDGFNTAQDQSNAVFTVPAHGPQAAISTPVNNQIYVADQTINLSGVGLDTEEGLLDGPKLSWSSNLNGLLGTGKSLSISAATLVEGTHAITLTATDSSNRTGTTNVSLKIFRSRPVFPATLSAGPTGLTFNEKTSLQTVAIRNDGDGNLTWTATADKPWIKLSAVSGTAPSNLDVTIIPGGLPFGNLTGKITLTSPEATNGPQVVNVNLAIVQGSTSTLSGRVVTPDGRGLRNATVSITDSQGVRRTATTSSFGFFSFDNVPVGETYTIRIGSRLYRFTPRSMQIISDVTLQDFVGLE